MSHLQLKKIQEFLQALTIPSEIQKSPHGHQLLFISHIDKKKRELKTVLSYVKGLFEKVPSAKTDISRSISIWQIQFVYPFQIDPLRLFEALKLINEINPRLPLAGFHFHQEKGSVAFQYCHVCPLGEDPRSLLIDLIGCAVNQYDHFLEEFEALARPEGIYRSL